MPLLTRTAVRAYATSKTAQLNEKRAGEILAEHKRVTASVKTFDVFLSHRYADKTELVGLMQMLEDSDISVLVDWKEHPELDRSKVTKETAATLKRDMGRCAALLFVVTSTASTSVWMPWELGLFDGMKGRVATVPLATKAGEFPGQEYAALYPWVDEAPTKGNTNSILWVNEAENVYVRLSAWLKGSPCTVHEP